MNKQYVIDDCLSEASLRGLSVPEKNHYFYGMLLSARNFSKEQLYHDSKRWLLNRLTLGKGVLTGLDLDVKCDGDPTKWRLEIMPGVAIDGFGREIIVPDRSTDGAGNVPVLMKIVGVENDKSCIAGTPGEFLGQVLRKEDIEQQVGGPFQLVVELAYRGHLADLTSVKAGSCANECVPSTMREEFQVRVRAPLQDERCDGVPGEELFRSELNWRAGGSLASIFPTEPREAIRHRLLAQETARLQEAPSRGKDAAWVPIGVIEMTVNWSGKSPVLEFARAQQWRYAREIFSNDALSKLIFSLAYRVDEAARVRVLTYDTDDGDHTSGEGQSGEVNQPLSDPLRLKVVNGRDGAPRDWESVFVEFKVLTRGGGEISGSTCGKMVQEHLYQVNHEGKVAVTWTLGDTPGLHTVAARIVPSPSSCAADDVPPFHPGAPITFHATASKPTETCPKGY